MHILRLTPLEARRLVGLADKEPSRYYVASRPSQGLPTKYSGDAPGAAPSLRPDARMGSTASIFAAADERDLPPAFRVLT